MQARRDSPEVTFDSVRETLLVYLINQKAETARLRLPGELIKQAKIVRIAYPQP